MADVIAKRIFLFSLPVLVCILAAAPVQAATPSIEAQALIGGTGNDYAKSVQQTDDGGYIVLGDTNSSASGDVTGTGRGQTDLWVARLSGAMAIEWQRLLGSSRTEYGNSIRRTSDSGYILAGTTYGSGGDGDVDGTNHGGRDAWVVKLDGAGTFLWQRVLGGSLDEEAWSVEQTADGGYILLGESGSSANGDVAGPTHGSSDFWFVKLDGAGAVEWERLLGGSGRDVGRSVQQTVDGGYILLGWSESSGTGNVTGLTHGGRDVWAVKLDQSGDVQWDRLLGGSGTDYGYDARQAADGGYVLLGESTSSRTGSVTAVNHGNYDYWVVKLDGAGTVAWDRLLGGIAYDSGRALGRTGDGGYILLGTSQSSANGNVTGTTRGGYDFWAVRLSDAGGIAWDKLLGGSGTDRPWAWSVQQTGDGGYVLLGDSTSSQSGDVSGVGHGGTDIWLVKLGADGPAPPAIAAVPGGAGLPTDTNTDSLYDDVNGNGRTDFADVVLYFNSMSWIAENEPVAAFDYNGNGRIDFADVVRLFTSL